MIRDGNRRITYAHSGINVRVFGSWGPIGYPSAAWVSKLGETPLRITPAASVEPGKLSANRQAAAGGCNFLIIFICCGQPVDAGNRMESAVSGFGRRRDHLEGPEELCDVERVFYFIGHQAKAG